jgi:Zn-finger nucleic acid-binding protein/ribosomal protein L40E
VRLVACRDCHTQYDVTDVAEPFFDCRCGANVRNEAQAAVDAAVQRCSACGALLHEKAEHCDYCRAAVVRAGSLSLICPECYARNEETAKFCVTCGVEFRPEALPHEQDATLACPACGGDDALAVRGVGGVWVRECGKCNGLWVPGDRFDSLVQRAIEAARQRNAMGIATPATARQSVDRNFRYRDCPACRGRMYRKNYGKRSGVIVDWCGSHGTWLDADELEQIAAFIASGGLRDAAPSATPGLSEGPRMTAEQFKAMAAVEQMLEKERVQRERNDGWGRSVTGSRSLLGLLVDLLR